MLAKLISLLPANWIRAAGSLQFKLPIVGPLIGLIGRKLIASEGVIKYGIGAGLRFDASGGFAGYLLGTSEPLEQETLARHLKPGDVFYDVGANIGFYSTIAARLVGASGMVYAFEPSPVSAQAVRENAARNGFDNVKVIEAAVSDFTGVARLVEGRMAAMQRIEAGDGVSVISIDEVQNLRPASVVMIDVEGGEIEVLRGMLQTIAKHRPVIMCEIHWIADEFFRFHNAELAPLGYEVKTLTGKPFPMTPMRFHVILLPA